MTGVRGTPVLLWLAVASVLALVAGRAAPDADGLAARLGHALAWHGGAFHPGVLAGHAVPFAAAAILLAGAAAAGAAGLGWLGLRRRGALLIALPAGFGLVAAAQHGLGLCGLAGPGPARALLGAAAWAGWRSRARLRAALPGSARAAWLAVLLLPAALPALAPGDHVDARIYHLAVPAWYAEHHRIVARPDWSFASLSQDAELAGLAGALATGDDRVPRALELGFALMLAALLAARPGGGGPAAAALLLTTPLLADLAGTSKNDVAFAAASVAALAALERGLAGGGLRWLAVAGWLGGAAYTVKNFGVFTIFALAAALAGATGVRRRPAAWAALLLSAAAPAVPFLARHGLELGTPLFPFLAARWRPVGWTLGDVAALGDVFNARSFSTASPAGLAASPLRALLAVSPWVLALAPVALVAPAVRARHAGALRFTAAWFAAWALLPTGGTERFLLPLLVPLLALAGEGAAAVPAAGLAGRVVRGLAPAWVLVQALRVLAGPAWAGAPLAAAGACESAAGWRARCEPVWTEAVGWLEGGGVALVGQGVQWPRPRAARLVGHEIEHAPPVWEVVRGARDRAHVARRLRQRGITRVLYNLPAANFWGPYAERFPWTPRDAGVWRDYWLAHARPAACSARWSSEEGFLILYDLAPRPGPAEPALFLPGTEAVFVAARRDYFDGSPVARVRARLAPYRAAFAGVLAFDARAAFLALDAGETRAAASALTALAARASPFDRRLAEFFPLPSRPRGGARAAPLTAWTPARLRTEAVPALAFNLGLPLWPPAR